MINHSVDDIIGNMKISKIKILKYKVSITLEDNSKIEVDKSVYPNFYLYVGKNLTKKDLDDIKHQNENISFLEYATKLRQKNSYTEYKMREKLYDKGAKKTQVEEVIKTLKKSGLINDHQFIVEHIEYYNSLNYGKNKIIEKLLEKGIFQEMIDRITFSTANEKKKANRIYKRLENKYAKYNDKQKKEHIYQAYISQGFDVEIAVSMVNQIAPSSYKVENNKLENEFNKVYKRYALKYNKKEIKPKLISYLASKGYKINDILRLLERKHIA